MFKSPVLACSPCGNGGVNEKMADHKDSSFALRFSEAKMLSVACLLARQEERVRLPLASLSHHWPRG